MVSPVSLSAAGVVIAGAAVVSLGLVHEPAPLPADVVAPVRFAPVNPVGTTPSAATHGARGAEDGAVAIPNRPIAFPVPRPEASAAGDHSGSSGRQLPGSSRHASGGHVPGVHGSVRPVTGARAGSDVEAGW